VLARGDLLKIKIDNFDKLHFYNVAIAKRIYFADIFSKKIENKKFF